MKPLILCIITIAFIFSCKKEHDPPEQIVTNEFSGLVAVEGRSPRKITAAGTDAPFYGGYALLADKEQYDISGSDEKGTVTLVITGVMPLGKYDFVPGRSSGYYVIYEEGIYPDYTLYASTVDADSTAAPGSLGSFTIINMTDTTIEGTMNVKLRSANGVDIKVDSVYFKGIMEIIPYE
jgi:hypothetical protein